MRKHIKLHYVSEMIQNNLFISTNNNWEQKSFYSHKFRVVWVNNKGGAPKSSNPTRINVYCVFIHILTKFNISTKIETNVES